MPKVALIIDDEPANIDLLKGLLPTNYKVKAALTGDKAIKLVERSEPDIIFLDLLMPGLSGYQTLDALQKIPVFNCPVVIVSGNATDLDISTSLKAGAVAHLQKPVDPTQIHALIQTYVEQAK